MCHSVLRNLPYCGSMRSYITEIGYTQHLLHYLICNYFSYLENFDFHQPLSSQPPERPPLCCPKHDVSTDLVFENLFETARKGIFIMIEKTNLNKIVKPLLQAPPIAQARAQYPLVLVCSHRCLALYDRGRKLPLVFPIATNNDSYCLFVLLSSA